MGNMVDVRAYLPCSIADLQRRLGRRSYSKLHAILKGARLCPAELAVRIEDATGGAVKRGLLRPDLWPSHNPSEDAA